jgi:hypothetical protein
VKPLNGREGGGADAELDGSSKELRGTSDCVIQQPLYTRTNHLFLEYIFSSMSRKIRKIDFL